MTAFTATNTAGSHAIQVHVTGCAHAIDPDRIVGQGDTPAKAATAAIKVVDPDGDWPEAWKVKVVACAKKTGAR